MDDDIERTVVKHVQKLTKASGVIVGARTSLIAERLLDSLDLLDLIEFIERTFHLKLTTEELNPDNFETPSAVAELIRRKEAP